MRPRPRASRARAGRRAAATASLPTLLLASLLVLGADATAARATDWTGWRGPEHAQFGASTESHLPGDWSPSGENLLWKVEAGARSTPVVNFGRVYVLNLAGEGEMRQERLMCLSEASGELLWEHRFNVFLTDIPDTRVGWSSPVVDPETGYVYVHGVQGLLMCLDPNQKGKVVWQRSLTEEFGRISGYGGRTHTPIVDEDRVIISFLNSSWGSHSRGSHRYVALDKRTGSVVWWSEPSELPPLDTTYSCPVISVVNGTRLLIGGNADGSVYAMKARTGEPVWQFRLSKRGINSSIVARDGKVWACHSEENLDETVMGRVVCIDATGEGDVTKTHEVWRVDGIAAGYGSLALDGDRLYAVDNSANVLCLDALKTDIEKQEDRILWTFNVGTAMRASPVIGDGKLYIGSMNGVFTVLDISGEKPELIRKHEFLTDDGRIVEINGSAAIANGRVYFATSQTLYCIGGSTWPGKSGPVATLPEEPELPSDAKANALLVVPGDVTLYAGQSTFFKARAFDVKGRAMGEVEPQWSVVGLDARIDERGRLTIANDTGFAQGLVKAQQGELTATARVRVVPRLPIEIDFEDVADGGTPAGWISATKVKFNVVEKDGSKALKKLAENPKFLLANAYLGLPTWSNYTVECDVLGTETRRQMPNIGIIANRYEMTLFGNHQRVRIVSWSPMPRIEAKASFKWDPDVWYRMKLRVERDDDRATVRGKVWPRGEDEPEEWTVTLDDPSPSFEGSPGIQGYSAGTTERSAGAEIYWDNLKISPND